MSQIADAKSRGSFLKQLREEHQETVARAQELLKEQKAIRREICQVMRDTAKSIPEIAADTGLPANQVLWHVTAMKKYGLVLEMGMCGEYYLYQMRGDKKQ
jgi:predicted transcriptional regulator